MSVDFLQQMATNSRRRADALGSLGPLRRAADGAPPVRPLSFGPGRLGIIAEFKRAAPSSGLLDARADPAARAREYTGAGAAAISVLTEPTRFLGSLEDLRRVREATHLPVMRKDFLVDPRQVLEARAAGADGVLLMVGILAAHELKSMLDVADELQMFALVEAFDAEEIMRARRAGARMIGVNSRDLRDFTVYAGRFRRLRRLIPADITAVAESGIRTQEQLAHVKELGFSAALIGTALMTGELSMPPLARASVPRPFIKICGVRDPETARAVAEAGATSIGLVFADSPRRVTIEQAQEICTALPPHIERIGVFQGVSAEEIRQVVDAANLTAAQVHGEAPELRCEVIPAVQSGEPPAAARAVVDSVSGGGSGVAWDYSRVREIAARRDLILAGGLIPENVGAAIRSARPYGVDVSSGVETAPGIKDMQKVRAFVRNARGAFEVNHVHTA